MQGGTNPTNIQIHIISQMCQFPVVYLDIFGARCIFENVNNLLGEVKIRIFLA